MNVNTGPGNSKKEQNPEILFGAGYSSCFLGAIHAVAVWTIVEEIKLISGIIRMFKQPKMNIIVPETTTVRSRTHIG